MLLTVHLIRDYTREGSNDLGQIGIIGDEKGNLIIRCYTHLSNNDTTKEI